MYTSVIGSLPDLAVGGLSIKDKTFNNFYIRNILTRENSIPPKAMMKWKQVHLFQNPWSDVNKYIIPNKVKETHFKVIHRFYVMSLSVNSKKDSHPYVVFVEESETISHLFSVVVILNYFGLKFLSLFLNCFINVLI